MPKHTPRRTELKKVKEARRRIPFTREQAALHKLGTEMSSGRAIVVPLEGERRLIKLPQKSFNQFSKEDIELLREKGIILVLNA